MRALKYIAVVAMTSVLAGCCYCKIYQKKFGRPLEKTRWTLVQVDGKPMSENYVLVLDKGEYSVTGNNLTIKADYRANNDGQMRLRNFAIDRAPKADSLMENYLIDAMRSTDGYKMDGVMLMMLHNENVWAIFEAKDPKK